MRYNLSGAGQSVRSWLGAGVHGGESIGLDYFDESDLCGAEPAVGAAVNDIKVEGNATDG